MSSPGAYGWTPVGGTTLQDPQCHVEFYQRGNIKMDYYPITGAVKTSISHPTLGKTQMFRRDLSETQFQAVMKNPRVNCLGESFKTKKT